MARNRISRCCCVSFECNGKGCVELPLSDDFSSFSSEWTGDTSDFQVASGVLQFINPGGMNSGTIVRCFIDPVTSHYVEAKIKTVFNATGGIILASCGEMGGLVSISWNQFVYAWEYVDDSGDSTSGTFGTPAVNDAVKIEITDAGGGLWDIDWYVNDALEHSETDINLDTYPYTTNVVRFLYDHNSPFGASNVDALDDLVIDNI